MKEWGRLITAMVTPFDKNLDVNYSKAVELANKLVNEGTTALVVSGTTGEAPTLTAEEKCELFRILKREVNVPIIAGIGTNSTRATIEMGKKAMDCGVDGALVVVPYYNKPNQEGLYRHFKAVAEEVKLPIMLYNVPSRTGGNMTADTSIALSKISNIVALKEAAGNLDQTTRVIQGCSEHFLVYTGEDNMILPTLCVGGYGVVSVASHVVGVQINSMINAYISGDYNKAAKLHQSLNGIFAALFMTTNPIPVKAALNLMGIDVGGLRLPLTEADSKVVDTLTDEMKKLGILDIHHKNY